MELSQVRLIVADFPRVYRFYRDVLRLKPQFESEHGPYAKFELPNGNAAIALHSRNDLEAITGPLGAPAGIKSLLVLHVDDIDTTITEWSARGARFTGPARDAWGRLRVAYLEDPEGNRLELQQWLAARS